MQRIEKFCFDVIVPISETFFFVQITAFNVSFLIVENIPELAGRRYLFNYAPPKQGE